MHKIFRTTFIIGVSLIILTPHLMGAALNLFGIEQDADVYIDEVYAGKGSLRDYEIEPGSHLVQVMKNDLLYYSKVIVIEYDETKTINLDNFVDVQTEIPNRGAMLREAERIRESKGNFGVGFSLGYLSGLSIKWFFLNNIAFQGTGWLFSNREGKYESYELRGVVTITDYIVNGRPASLYLAGGYGYRRNTYSDVEQSVLDINLGIEMSLFRSMQRSVNVLHNPDASQIFLSIFSNMVGFLLSADNAYLSLEVGLGSISENKMEAYTGIMGRMCVHYFF
ncbi:hypothetical protein ACFL96_19575 [Thermoproteota archaeon]